MKKARPDKDDLRAEYDLRRLGPGVTGKYFRRATAGANLVLLDPDVARVFPDAESVNRALRLLMDIAEAGRPAVRRKRPGAAKARQAGVAAKSAVSGAASNRQAGKKTKKKTETATGKRI